jgi:predicted acetyltransferase
MPPMNSSIRKLNPEEIRTFIDIVINAYPGMVQNALDFKERYYNSLLDIQENDESINLYGLFRDGKLVGGMRIQHFTMNLFSNPIEGGGIGLVAVDLLHKKEKVAKELVQYFIEYFREHGTSFVMLYPFRPDFYKKMGFGYGMKMNQYEIEPSSFPNHAKKLNLHFLDELHKELIRDCYNHYAAKTHGMVQKTNQELQVMFKNPNRKLVGYLHEGKVEGYILFSFKKKSETNFLDHDLVIHEWVYENPNALATLNAFLHSQADQVQRVILHSQDQYLPFLFHDSRNGTNQIIPSVYHETNTSGVGLMYKIIDIVKFIDQLQLVSQVNSTFKLTVIDTFNSSEPISHVISVSDRRLHVIQQDQFDFEVEIDISDLSSLLMGSIDVHRLYQYGLLKLNDISYLETLEQIFSQMKEPVCMTAF